MGKGLGGESESDQCVFFRGQATGRPLTELAPMDPPNAQGQGGTAGGGRRGNCRVVGRRRTVSWSVANRTAGGGGDRRSAGGAGAGFIVKRSGCRRLSRLCLAGGVRRCRRWRRCSSAVPAVPAGAGADRANYPGWGRRWVVRFVSVWWYRRVLHGAIGGQQVGSRPGRGAPGRLVTT